MWIERRGIEPRRCEARDSIHRSCRRSLGSAGGTHQALHALIRPSTPGSSMRGTKTAGTGGSTPSTPRSRSTGGPFRSEPNSPPSAAAARPRLSSHRSQDPPTSTPSSSTVCLRSLLSIDPDQRHGNERVPLP